MFKAYYDTKNGEVYCEFCAPANLEMEALPQETDSPENCAACHRPIDCPLTTEGVASVLAMAAEAIEHWPEGAKIREAEADDYYKGSRQVEPLLDQVKDLKGYDLKPSERFIVEHLLRLANPPKKKPTAKDVALRELNQLYDVAAKITDWIDARVQDCVPIVNIRWSEYTRALFIGEICVWDSEGSNSADLTPGRCLVEYRKEVMSLAAIIAAKPEELPDTKAEAKDD